MRRRLLVLPLLALASPAWAAGPALDHCYFEWSQAASPELASFHVYLSPTPLGPYTKLATIPSQPGNATTVTAYGPSANLCAAVKDGQQYAFVTSVDTAGQESEPSNVVPFVLDAVVSSPPTNVRVK
jgi:hypothetical protein